MKNNLNQMQERTCKVAFGKQCLKLTKAEQSYANNLLDRHLIGDKSRGGFRKDIAKYVDKGGRLPKGLWWQKKK